MLARLDLEIRQEATSIVADYLATGGRVSDSGEGMDPGWSSRRQQIAIDGRAPIKQQPGYLAHAVRMLESYHRSDAHRENAAPVLNADIQILVQQTVNQYPTLKLSKG